MIFVSKPCKTDSAYEVLPKTRIRINLEESCEKLVKGGYEIVVTTPHIAVIKKIYEISIFPSGRLLIKDLTDKKIAEDIAREVYALVL
ncbi:MAG: hypothetical protein ACE5K4_11490 [Candidatus Hydrothermarchaeota archaeon]